VKNRLEFDYVIVGAGSAGCVLANRLSANPEVTVCLLEAGPRDRSPFIHIPVGIGYLLRSRTYNWQFYTEPQKELNNRRLYTPRGRMLGGSSSMNAMVYTRGVPADYDHWETLGGTGWGWRDVLPYFKRAEDNTRGADDYHGKGGPLGVTDLRFVCDTTRAFIKAGQLAGYPLNDDFNGAVQEGIGEYQVTHRNGQRCSSARAYLEPVRERSNLTVMTGAQAGRVLLKNQRASGVELVDRRRIEARCEVILSAGAIQSPQLMMLSGIGPESELKQHDIEIKHCLPGVGQNLQDHLDILLVQRCREPASFAFTPRGMLRGVKGLWDYATRRQGMFTSTVAEAGGFIKTRPELEYPDCQLHLTSALLKNHGLELEYGYGWSLHICDLRPKSRGYVGLHSADPLQAAKIDPRYLSEAADMEQMVEAYKLAQDISLQQPFKDLNPHWKRPNKALYDRQEIREFVRAQAETIYHPVGTCKMGTDGLAVVDPQLRVRGIDNLRVVDASIMPTLVGGNTNAPTIMIGEKAADMIVAGQSTVDINRVNLNAACRPTTEPAKFSQASSNAN